VYLEPVNNLFNEADWNHAAILIHISILSTLASCRILLCSAVTCSACIIFLYKLKLYEKNCKTCEGEEWILKSSHTDTV
ncbi:MAG: hypothetical protein SPI84_00055, partial [Anaerovoracaceae bacterium]|nr:hypothetical protein [Anaerovoracaceae bacterium]